MLVEEDLDDFHRVANEGARSVDKEFASRRCPSSNWQDSRDNKNDQYTQGIEEENRACHERSFLIPRPVGEHQQKAPALLGERCIKNILNHALVIWAAYLNQFIQVITSQTDFNPE